MEGCAVLQASRALALLFVVATSSTTEAGSVRGVVYADLNGNGRQDANEPGVGSAIVAYETTAFVTADSTGHFTLPLPEPATGNVWVRVPDGYAPGPVWAKASGATSIALGVRPIAAPTAPLTFVVASDTHLTSAQPFAHDLATVARNATALVPPPAFFLIAGDITQGGSTDDFSLARAQLSGLGVPFVPVPGNHDCYYGCDDWDSEIGPGNYSFDIAGVHFVVWNMALQDYEIEDYLTAELAHVDPAMTIVALGHAPPSPAVIATLRTLGVDYVMTGHTHTNRMIDHDGMIELNSEPLLMGGLDFTPGGYRVVSIAAGKLRAYHRTVVDRPFLQLMSPVRGQCIAPDGDIALVAAEIDAGALEVSAAIDGGSRICGIAKGGWVYSLPTPELAAGTHTLDVTATSASGAHAAKHATFSVCTEPSPILPSTDWAQPGGDATHAGAVAAALAPPLVPRWSQQIGGHALQQAPVIAGGLVIETASDLGDETTGGVVAIDIATGEQVWRTPAITRGGPLVIGSVVVVAELDGEVLGLDLDTGDVRWTTSLADGISYIEAAPAADDGEVFIGNEHKFARLDPETGAPNWVDDPITDPDDYFTTDDAMAIGSGFVIGSLSREGGVSAWDRDTGALVWNVTATDETEGVNGSPVIVGNVVYVVDSTGGVTAYELATGTKKWRVRVDSHVAADSWSYAIASAPAISGHVIVVPTMYGDLVALDTRAGKQLWRHTAEAGPLRTTHYRGSGMAGYEASPVITHDVVWAADTAGVLVALDLETGRELWKTALGAPVLAPLAVADGWLVAATYDGTVHAWSLPYGSSVTDALEPASGCCGARSDSRGGLAIAALVGLAWVRRKRVRARYFPGAPS